MSSSEPVDFTPLRGTRKSGGERFHLQVRAQQRTGAMSGDTRITVRNGWDELVSEGYGQIALDLERGLYTLRLERGGASREEVIRHIATSKFEPIEPQRSSALPTFDTWDAHEYYSWTAQSLSHQNTGAAATVFGGLQAAGRLFIFVRAVEAGKWPVLDPFEGLLLFDLNGKYLTGFGPEVVARHGLDAWAAFSAPAPAGTYLLRYVGLEPHEMVLSVFAGWETQLFVPYGHRPHLSRASLLLARLGQGFHPDDRVAQAIDAGVGGLESGVDILPQEGRRLLLSGKFDNPMLGLIGAHLLLLNTEPDWQLLRIVLGNLENLLPGAADVRALRIAIALRRGEGPQTTPARVPPMLRRGLDAIIEASSTMPEIVPEGGVIERIAPYLLAETPWSISALPGSGVAGTRDDDMPAWVHNLLEDARNEALRQDRSPDLMALAQQAKLPLSQLRRWLTQFDLALFAVDQKAEEVEQATKLGAVRASIYSAVEGARYLFHAMHSLKTEGFAVKRHELEQRLSDTQIVLNDLREVGRSVEIEQNELDGAKDLLEFIPEKADVVSPPDVHPRHIDVGVPSSRTKHHISAIINGEPVKFVCASAQTLLDVLRDELSLTGSKEGCISGDCGAFTVIVDGNMVCSCLMLGAEAEGRNIQTIEGIAEGDKLHPVQQKFLEHAALQCGFCTAGFIVAAKALLDHNLSPTEEETRYWLAGNLCRCTGYDKIIHAVLDAAGEMRARA